MPDIPEKINLSDVNSRQVDSELLNELRDLFVKAEEQKERYDFTWNGKAKAYFEAAAPTTKTLRAQPEESVNFEKSENLFITGDNLEALKLLQESYLGKIDMIYIDPPYNTGKDFVYQDNFKKTQKENDVSEGIIDEEGNRLVKNEKSNGRYHSDWLTMMYPRLKLARNLLSDTGAIFVSIDDNEQSNLKLLMDEVFGEDNFISNLIWKSKSGGANDSRFFATDHEYVVVYAKNTNFFALSLDTNGESSTSYNNEDEKGQYSLERLDKQSIQYSESMNYEIVDPEGNKYFPKHIDPTKPNASWRWGKTKVKEKYDELVFKNGNVYTKNYKKDGVVPRSLLIDDRFGRTRTGKTDLTNLFGVKNIFSAPKPPKLLKFLIDIASQKDSIILDFFAGSGSTADAVMQLNKENKESSRKYILSTLDECVPDGSVAQIEGYTSIDQISRERIRRAAEKNGDTSGFRALKVDSTGLKEDVFKTAGELDQVDLLKDIDNHSDNRSDYDLLYDVLVDSALEYNRPITIDTTNDEQIIKYDYFGELSGVVCYFGENLTDELTRQIATLKPLIAVFKESTFDKSAQKVNVMEQFRIISPDTKVKVI